jgi:adenosylmethionine-8-amino-7-oxononanoate aminotransferase
MIKLILLVNVTLQFQNSLEIPPSGMLCFFSSAGFYSPHYLRRVHTLCDIHNALLISNEIAKGFGRTGKIFAVEHARIVPNILCISKALSGGFMSFVATMTEVWLSSGNSNDNSCSKSPGVLMHGPTFMGSPLACAVGLASLQLLQSSDYNWQVQVAAIETQLTKELEEVRAIRVLGAIEVVGLNEPIMDNNMKQVQHQLVQQGVWLWPFGRLLYTMPPFLIQPHQLCKITTDMVSLASRCRA